MRALGPTLIPWALAINSCMKGQRAEPVPFPSAHEAEAIVRSDYARFVFPRDTAQEYLWDVPEGGAYIGRPDFSWEVNWDTGDLFLKDTHTLWLGIYCRSGCANRNNTASLSIDDSVL